MRAILSASLSSIALLALAACNSDTTNPADEAITAAVYGDETLSPEATDLDRQQLLDDLRILSADDMQGRAAGTEGNARARAYIISRFEQIGVPALGESYEHGFEYFARVAPDDLREGVNIVARLDGTGDTDHTMVVTAHYDHEGVRNEQIYNGADDNASGIAAMLAVAADFVANPPEHDVIFVAFDAEERGLQGARAFVNDPPIARENITFNLNLDMVAMSDDRLLWVVGTYHYPFLKPIAERIAAVAPVNFPTGFDEPTDVPGGDWTMLSDQGAFHAVGIPNIYLGVDFHPHYHQPSDIYENMTLDFFQDASQTIVLFARAMDDELSMVAAESGR